MNEKKYIMTGETKTLGHGKILHRIQAIRNFGDVKQGDLGGFVEKEWNLSHEGDCWVYNDAMVYDNAIISGFARIYNKAKVYNYARVHGSAKIFGTSHVYGTSVVKDNARACGNSRIHDNAIITGCAIVVGDAHICDNAVVGDNATIRGNSTIYGYACIYGNAIVNNARVCDVDVCGLSNLGNGANVSSIYDFVSVGPIGSRKAYTTFYRNKNNGISVSCGCFHGTLDEFKCRLESVYGENGESPIDVFYNQYISACDFAVRMIMHESGNLVEE